MKVSILQDVLAKGLGLADLAIASKVSMPVLSHVLVEAEGDRLRLTGTNREQTIRVTMQAKVDEPGSLTVPARLFGEFVKSLPVERVDLDTTVKTPYTLRLACARFTATIKGFDPAEFPTVGLAGPPSPEVVVPVDALVQLIDQTAYAAGRDEAKPTLTGLSMIYKLGGIELAGTDGYRLAYRFYPCQAGIDQITITPGVALREVATLAKEAAKDGDALLYVEASRRLTFVLPGKANSGLIAIELGTPLIDARFPDFWAIVPKSKKTQVTVDVAALDKALKVAKLFARDNANIVQLTCLPGNDPLGYPGGTLRISAVSSEMGDSATDLNAMVEGEGVAICFNVAYLLELLAPLTTAQIVFQFTEATRPLFAYPNGLKPEETFVVLMPMHPPK